MKTLTFELRHRGLFRRFLGLLVLALFLSTCSDSTTPLLTFWEGALDPVGPNVLGGRVVAVTQHGRTNVGISIRDGDPETTYGWRMSSGTCDQEGAILSGPAAYPPLLTGQGGSATAEAVISTLFKPGLQFSARVFRSEDGDPEEVVACGDLEQT